MNKSNFIIKYIMERCVSVLFLLMNLNDFTRELLIWERLF